MNIRFYCGSRHDSTTCSKQVPIHLVRNLQHGDPDAYASEIVESRRVLIAELEQRRRFAAVGA